MGPGVQLIELGSGSSHKIRLLLDLLQDARGYVPVDISSEHLRRAAEAVARDHPAIPVTAICADYTVDFDLPPALQDGFTKRVAFFPGSTIGNLMPEEALALLRSCAALVGRGGDMLIGVDRKKPTPILDAAYNDSQGVTAAFNLNLLTRINRELGADFDLSRFAHLAFYNEAEGRIEIYIESRVDQLVHIAGHGFRLRAGERIHTEYSYKYGTEDFQAAWPAAPAGRRSTIGAMPRSCSACIICAGFDPDVMDRPHAAVKFVDDGAAGLSIRRGVAVALRR